MRNLSLRETVLLTENAIHSFQTGANTRMLLDSMQEVVFETYVGDFYNTCVVRMDGEKIASDSVEKGCRPDVTFLLERIQMQTVGEQIFVDKKRIGIL